MKPKSFTIVASAGGTTYSPAYPIDTFSNPTNIGIGVVVNYGIGSVAYTVQHTFTDPGVVNLNSGVSAGVWQNNTYIVGATSASSDTNYAFPPAAIRFALAAAASASITGTIIQAGPTN